MHLHESSDNSAQLYTALNDINVIVFMLACYMKSKNNIPFNLQIFPALNTSGRGGSK